MLILHGSARHATILCLVYFGVFAGAFVHTLQLPIFKAKELSIIRSTIDTYGHLVRQARSIQPLTSTSVRHKYGCIVEGWS